MRVLLLAVLAASLAPAALACGGGEAVPAAPADGVPAIYFVQTDS